MFQFIALERSASLVRFCRLLPFDTSEAILVKVFSLVDVVLDTIWYGVAANEALGRVVTMATLTLKRAIGLGIETLAS